MRVGYVEPFGVQQFQGSDEDIQFYTGLPSYSIFIWYLEPNIYDTVQVNTLK